MKNLFLVSILCICLSGFYSCTKDTAKVPVTVVCDSTKVRFTEDIYPIFKTNCATTGCHDAITKQDGYDYSQYIDSKTSVQNTGSGSLICRIQGRTCGVRMPEGAAPLSDSAIQKVIQWQTDGFCD